MPTETDNKLPEGTDRIIPGATRTASDMETELIVEQSEGNPTSTASSTKRDKVVAKVNEARQNVAREAAGKTRGIIGDGLSKGSEAIGSMSRLVGDTASNIDESLGAEYGDYARSTARYLDETAQKIAAKDPDELVEDVRGFVRKSPGIALGAAAVVGFALARVIQSGFDAERDDADADHGGGTDAAARLASPEPASPTTPGNRV
ncbi:hypothetical protein [Sphingomicrobium astaxanthinifaciens]|uniref:hypothetical protein n=1 Tax=Sphingomicrobium astaxanthinifaciens TaxID=1227949 RepID=UPI001FCC50A1|nr:hypothetical protein [Sphingomicrobium astaxanthinifaciens]MCJ7422333.1 hypothetical protein [Sphingomicrobium astaxanthinifaciens]